jgi:tetratricopeptide (TPR) repeat protein
VIRENLKSFLLFTVVLSSLSVSGQRIERSTVGTVNQEFSYAFSEATKYYLFGNYVQAITLYKECIKIKPENSASHFQLSKIYLNAGNTPLAREHAKKAYIYSKENIWYMQNLADIYQLEQKYDSAISIYKEIVKIQSDNVNVYFTLSSLNEKLKNYNEALKYLDLIENKIGISREVSLSKYRIYDVLNMPEKAIEKLKEANQLSMDEYNISGLIAEYYRKHDEPDSAQKYYNEIYPKYKSDPMVAFSYAEFLMENGSADSAGSIVVSVMADKSVDNVVKASYFFNLLQNESTFVKMKPAMDTASTVYYLLYYDDVRAMSIYADVQLRLRNFQKAADVLERLVRSDDKNYPAIEQLLYVLNIMGKSDSVLVYSRKAIQYFEDKPIPYLFNGTANFQKKAYDDAIVALNKGLILAKDDNLRIEFYSLLAECYQQVERFTDSEKAFKEALSIDNENAGIKNNYAYYLALRNKSLKEAEKLSYSTIKKEPENSTYLDTYAWVLFKSGKYKSAKKFIILALKFSKEDNPEILSHSADILIKLKDYTEAIKYLKKIIEISGSEKEIEVTRRIREIENLQ